MNLLHDLYELDQLINLLKEYLQNSVNICKRVQAYKFEILLIEEYKRIKLKYNDEQIRMILKDEKSLDVYR